MKRQSIVLIILVVLLAGCTKPMEEDEEQVPQVQIEETGIPKPVEEAKLPQIEQEMVPAPQEAMLTKAEQAVGIEMVRIDEPRQSVVINTFDTRRISRDRGELRWVNITVKNLGDKDISPQVTFWFRTTDYEEPEKVIIERVIDVPRLAPMRKYTKRYPATIYYDNINEMKDIELQVHDLSVGPKKKLGDTKLSFSPVKAFPTMEISW